MELKDRFGGLGVISLSQNETEKVQTLNEIISKNGIKDFIGRDSQKTPEYNAIMEELFPVFPLSYDVCKRNTNRFLNKTMNPLGDCSELVIRSKLYPKGKLGEAELSIVFPNGQHNKDYLMTISLHYLYKFDVIDDVAQLLGKREIPAVSAPQKILWWDRFRHEIDTTENYFGFAEVPYLGMIRKVYDNAMRLVDDSEMRISVCRKDLDVLRNDAAEHPNVVIRKQSKSMYNSLLETLTNQ